VCPETSGTSTYLTTKTITETCPCYEKPTPGPYWTTCETGVTPVYPTTYTHISYTTQTTTCYTTVCPVTTVVHNQTSTYHTTSTVTETCPPYIQTLTPTVINPPHTTWVPQTQPAAYTTPAPAPAPPAPAPTQAQPAPIAVGAASGLQVQSGGLLALFGAIFFAL